MKKILTIWIISVALFLGIIACSNEEPNPEPDPPITEIPKDFYKNQLAPMPLPSTLKIIGENAFYACQNEFIVLPEGVTKIGDYAFAIGHSSNSSIGGLADQNIEVGKLKWIYLPSSLETIGERALAGVYTSSNGETFYSSNPNVVLTSPKVPDGLFDAIYVHGMSNHGYVNYDDEEYYDAPKIYVPEEYLNTYIAYRNENFKRVMGEDSENYLKYARNCLPIHSYKPVSVAVSFLPDNEMKATYTVLPDNRGEITSVRWDVSKPQIATISDSGIINPRKAGNTYIQCIVGTKASNGNDINFYFFEPLEITEKMLKK